MKYLAATESDGKGIVGGAQTPATRNCIEEKNTGAGEFGRLLRLPLFCILRNFCRDLTFLVEPEERRNRRFPGPLGSWFLEARVPHQPGRGWQSRPRPASPCPVPPTGKLCVGLEFLIPVKTTAASPWKRLWKKALSPRFGPPSAPPASLFTQILNIF